MDIAGLSQLAFVVFTVLAAIVVRYERTVSEIKKRLSDLEVTQSAESADLESMRRWSNRHDRDSGELAKEVHQIALDIAKMSATIAHILTKIERTER